MTTHIMVGDCRERLQEMDDASVHAVVTDPPYEIGFMGRAWDSSGIAYDVGMWREVLRVLKPGGHLLSFGGTRTYHRLVCAIEDAGFEIRDQLQWLYGSGFPKSLDVGKAIDKAAGADREVLGRANGAGSSNTNSLGEFAPEYNETIPATEAARTWDGWGTALKPASEPIVLARKPFPGTVANNVLAHGCGGINVDVSRINAGDGYTENCVTQGGDHFSIGSKEHTRGNKFEPSPSGRWPSNVILGCACEGDKHEDGCAVAILDDQSGELQSGKAPVTGFVRNSDKHRNTYGKFKGNREEPTALHGDSGGASRFFYVAKPSPTERHTGGTNTHATVKPIELIAYLVRMITPPGGTVLDPFLGSGTTAMACARLGFECIGIEISEEHVVICKRRIREDQPLFADIDVC